MTNLLIVIEAAKLPTDIARDSDHPVAEAIRMPVMQASFGSLGVEGAPMDLEDLAVVLREEEDRWAKAAHDGLLPTP